MSCRHQDGDPNCSTKNPQKMAEKASRAIKEADAMAKKWTSPSAVASLSFAPDSDLPASPNPDEFELVRWEIAGAKYLIVEAQYPSCASCSYEGRKLMVFDVTGPVFWRRIDPHFRDPAEKTQLSSAPPPIARFPANDRGWALATLLCETLGKLP